MSNFTPARIGLVSADNRALFLKLYAGEVITVFEQNNIVLPLTMVKTLTSGKSYSFPVTGTVTGGYHTPGDEISGQATEQNEKIITVDDLLVASVFVDNMEEKMSSFDGRAIYAQEAGRFLAQTLDKKLLITLLQAARTTSPAITGQPAGESIAVANMRTDKAVLKAALLSAAQKFDEKDVPSEGRNVILRPAQFYLLLTDDEVISDNYDVGGSSKNATVGRYAGIDIHKSNHIPITDITNGVLGTGVSPNDYTADFQKTVGPVFTKQAIGTVKLMDIATESEYSVRHQGTLVVAKYAMGHGVLRPECAIELAIP